MPFALHSMDQTQDSKNKAVWSIDGCNSIRPSDITEIICEHTHEFMIYRGMLSNGRQLITKKDYEGHIECCRSSFPYEEELFGLYEVELPNYYFDMLQQLYTQRQ